MENIFYLGGFKETCNSDASLFLKKELGTKCVPIDWNTTLEENVKNTYTLLKSEKKYKIIAFSLGCLIAIKVVAELEKNFPESCQGILLCSMSPFYSGYTGKQEVEVKNLIGKNLFDELMLSPAGSDIGNIKAKITFVTGEREDAIVKRRIRELIENNERINSEWLTIANVGHNIHDVNYLAEISRIMKSAQQM